MLSKFPIMWRVTVPSPFYTATLPTDQQGTFFDKANTVKAHMAGGSLVQRAEFLVGIDALKTWGNKIPLMVALVRVASVPSLACALGVNAVTFSTIISSQLQ
jgi:hypothetical protein